MGGGNVSPSRWLDDGHGSVSQLFLYKKLRKETIGLAALHQLLELRHEGLVRQYFFVLSEPEGAFGIDRLDDAHA